MLKRYTFWLWLAIELQLITGGIHAISLFASPDPATLNAAERQLHDLMSNQRMNMGAGFHRSMGDLFTAVSSCYTLLCFLGAFTNAYLLKTRVEARIVKDLTVIQLVVFAVCFGVMIVYAFLPPIVLTGLITLSLAVSIFTNKVSGVVQDA